MDSVYEGISVRFGIKFFLLSALLASGFAVPPSFASEDPVEMLEGVDSADPPRKDAEIKKCLKSGWEDASSIGFTAEIIIRKASLF